MILPATVGLAGEIKPPKPELVDLSVAIWPSEEIRVDELKPLGIHSVKVFTGVPRSLRGVDVLALVDGWDVVLDEEGDAKGLRALLKAFVEGGGMLVVFPPEEPGPDVPTVVPVGVKWEELEQQPGGQGDVIAIEFADPEHPAVKEMGMIEDVDVRMTVSPPAKVILRHTGLKVPMIAVADVGKGHVVLFGFLASSIEDMLILRSIGLWAAGATKPPGPEADRQALAAAHLARGFGSVVTEEILSVDFFTEPTDYGLMELAKAKGLAGALTSLILDPERPEWKPGIDHAGWKALQGLISALGSDDPGARHGARWSLTALSPLAYEPLLAAAKSEGPLVKAGAEEVLHVYRRALSSDYWGEPDEAVREMMEEAERVAGMIRESLGITEDVEKLIGWLRTGKPERVALAAEELGRARDPRAVGALCEALAGTKDGSARRAVGEALAAVGGADAFEALRKAVEGETDIYTLSTLCQALMKFEGREKNEVMARVVSRPGWQEKDIEQLVSLASVCREDTAWRRTLVKRALESESPRARVAAVRQARPWDGPEVLVGVLDDPDREVRMNAGSMLGRHFARTHPQICHKAFVKLLGDKGVAPGIMGSMVLVYRLPEGARLVPEAAKALLPWIEIENPLPAALSAARHLRHKTLLEPLVKLLDHGDRNVRAYALMALANWAVRSGFRQAGGDEAAQIRALKEWMTANPDFLEGGRPVGPVEEAVF